MKKAFMVALLLVLAAQAAMACPLHDKGADKSETAEVTE